MERTLNQGTRASMGRPLGALIAWLKRGDDPGCTTRAVHKAKQPLLTHAERLEARLWGESLDHLAPLFAVERVLVEGEGPEPIAIP